MRATLKLASAFQKTSSVWGRRGVLMRGEVQNLGVARRGSHEFRPHGRFYVLLQDGVDALHGGIVQAPVHDFLQGLKLLGLPGAP